MRTASEAQLCREFGTHLAQIRKSKGWSQEKLALESGIARSYVGDVERGIRNIALVNICKIADTLEIEASELMQFHNQKKKISTDQQPMS
jgi:transcriptional regulator with XRE-family HTH domain